MTDLAMLALYTLISNKSIEFINYMLGRSGMGIFWENFWNFRRNSRGKLHPYTEI